MKLTPKQALIELLDSINPTALSIKDWRKIKKPYWIGSKTIPSDESVANAIDSLKRSKNVSKREKD